MAALIAENSYLIPDYEKESYAKKNRYLMIVTDLEAEMDQNSDEVLNNLEHIKKNVMLKMEKVNNTLKKVKKQNKKFEYLKEK